MTQMMNWIERIITLLKGDPWLRTGKYLFVASLASISGVFPEVTVEIFGLPVSIANSIAGVCYVIALIGCMAGLLLIGVRYFQLNATPSVLYYGQGMSNMDDSPPIYALPLAERGFARTEMLGLIDSYDRSVLIDKLNFYRNLFENRTKHKAAQKLYLAALGSFPYLYALGTLLRNAHGTVRILEHARNASGGNKWHVLDTISDEENITHLVQGDEARPYMNAVKELSCNANQDIGLALSYSFEISQSDLPESLRDSTVILKHSLGNGLDKLSNDSYQEKLLSELTVILNTLSKRSQRVHLFVSAQASMCINLGKCYQDNVHAPLQLYSYTRDQGYNWSISFDQGTFS